MKEIQSIDIIPPGYSKKLLGDQVRITETPFGIKAGTLVSDGNVENGSPAVRNINIPSITIAGGVTAVTVLEYENKHYRSMIMSLRATTNPTHFDMNMYFLPRDGGNLTLGRIISESGTTRWRKDTNTGTGSFSFAGDAPMGDGAFNILIDNGDAVAALIIEGVVSLSDPIR